MIAFRPATISDKPWVDVYLQHANQRGCEYNFTSFFIWGGVYNQRLAKVGNHLVANLCGTYGCSFMFPLGEGDIAPAIEAMEAHAQGRGAPLQLVALSRQHVEELETRFPNRFSITAETKHFDYCYDIEKLCNLAGKKLHGKRNHIRRFEENYPTWRFEPLTPDFLPQCLALSAEWERASQERAELPPSTLPSPESRALERAANHYEALGMEGGMIWVEDKLMAFTMGSLLVGDTFDVHFEKAYGEIQGAFPIINREFARYLHEKYPHIRYLNREDDMGLPGLRRAKESYYPDLMVEKYTAIAR